MQRKVRMAMLLALLCTSFFTRSGERASHELSTQERKKASEAAIAFANKSFADKLSPDYSVALEEGYRAASIFLANNSTDENASDSREGGSPPIFADLLAHSPKSPAYRRALELEANAKHRVILRRRDVDPLRASRSYRERLAKLPATDLQMLIEGGSTTKDIPAVVAIQTPKLGNKLCSGVLVSQNHVITAYHCVCRSDESICGLEREVFVFFGNQYYGAKGHKAKVVATDMAHDVAAVALAAENPPPKQKLLPIDLPERLPDLSPGVIVHIAGFGGTKKSGFGVELETTLLVIETRCDGSLPSVCDKGQLLLGGLRSEDPYSQRGVCPGDSGGPAFLVEPNSKKRLLVGIVTDCVRAQSSEANNCLVGCGGNSCCGPGARVARSDDFRGLLSTIGIQSATLVPSTPTVSQIESRLRGRTTITR